MPAPSPAMVESEDESMWDWWPTVSVAGVQVTELQARTTGLMLHQRARKYMEAGPPLLKKRDYEGIQDNRTLRDVCVTGQQFLSHDILLALLEPFTAPAARGLNSGTRTHRCLSIWTGARLQWAAGGIVGAGFPHCPLASLFARTLPCLDWAGNRSWMATTNFRVPGYWIPYSGSDRP
eukprot:3552758-Amphidinium_carterae.2